ncbi:MAG: phosphatase PAP2 family protein [Candidatus Jorgensenbacteria bacterium]|nr:phosphatase PAP2 family protein [Candidatus Jorgensenbacteria bacterium]
MSFDLQVFELIHSFVGKMRVLDWFSIFLAEYATYLIVIGGIVIILLNGSVRERIKRLLVGALALVLSLGIFGQLLHFFIARPRPFLELGFNPLFMDTGAAFPSRHAITLFIIALIVFSSNRKWGYWFFGFALINGLARIYAGVHWPADILGGFILAAICFYAIRAIVGREDKQKENIVKDIPQSSDMNA